MAALYELLSLITHFIGTSQIKDQTSKYFFLNIGIIVKIYIILLDLHLFGLVKTGQIFGLYCIGSCTNLGGFTPSGGHQHIEWPLYFWIIS